MTPTATEVICPEPVVKTAPAGPAALEVTGLTKRYGEVLAVDDLSLWIEPGTAFGLLGPNGSGKTTTVECLQGLRAPDSGSIRLLGLDPSADRSDLWRRVGVLFQETTYHNRIRLREAIWLAQSFYPHPLDGDELLERFGLQEKRDTYFCRLSGGQQRRFLTLLALLGRPELAILDEPTSGLDPQARSNVWEILRDRCDNGMSVLITTHQLDEAEELCDVVAIMDRGRLLCVGAPRELLQQHGLEQHAVLPHTLGLTEPELLAIPGVTHVQISAHGAHVYGAGKRFTPNIVELVQGASVADMSIRSARLEDLFLLLTGRAYREV